MKNWKKVKLGSLLTESKVVSKKPDTNKRLRVKLNVKGVEKRPKTNDKVGATKYYIRTFGQFIYGRQNLHKGAFGIVPKDLEGFESSLDIPAFDVHNSCYPEWIFYFFRKDNFYLKLERLAKGVGSKRINPKQIFELDIYLPSKEEQRGILHQIKKIDSKQRDVLIEIERQEQYVSKLRQSILQEAVQGELTEAWNKENIDIEPASELLNRIKEEKKKLIKEKTIKKEKPLPPISKDEIPFEIPASWSWCRFGNLKEYGSKISYGVLIPGPNIKNGVPLIRVGDLKKAKTGSPPDKSIAEDIALKYKRTQLEGGEILITVVGGSIGMAVIAHEKWKGANIARAVSRIKVNPLLDTNYLFNCVQSPYIQNYFMNSSRTVGQPTLNIGIIEKTLFPVPPLMVQIKIAKKINQLIDYCDRLEQEIKTSKRNTEKLMQSFLSELLGKENNFTSAKETKRINEDLPIRTIKYDRSTTLMELVTLLEKHGKLHAKDLWQMSKFPDDIDQFYAELKKQIEEMKTIKEVKTEKGYLEIV